MTHEDLLDVIDFDEGSEKYEKVFAALRAVVELHKPHDITLPDGYYGTDCSVCHGYQYPCPTIQAIEKELK